MLESLPAVAKCSPVLEKSQQRMQLSFSSTENMRFMVGMWMYSKRPSALPTPITADLEFAVGLHLP